MKRQPGARRRTADRAPPADTARVIGQIGPKRQRLGNGFLLCRDVPVARTGWMMYQPGEVPIKTRDNHPVAYVQRDATELFSPTTIGSLITATVTDNHPAVDVTPQNAGHLGRGYCLDARQGDGDDADVLLADIVITDPHAIERIENMDKPGGRPVEISLGYEADYFQTGPGEGRQANILINHIALVDRGRCGPRCAIGDSAPEPTIHKEPFMAGKTTPAPRQRVKINDARAKLALALEELDEAEQEDTGDADGVHVHVHTADAEGGTRTLDAETEGRLGAVETGLQELAGGMAELTGMVREALAARTPTTDAAPGTDGDSKALERSFQDFVSQAEVLVPGFKVPTFDSAAARVKTVDSMCAGRRSVLTKLADTPDGKTLLDNVTGGELDIQGADCAAVAIAFRSAAALKGAKNNSAVTRDHLTIPKAAVGSSSVVPRPSMSAADVNEANRKFWAARNGGASA